jgi:hypothetical protein
MYDSFQELQREDLASALFATTAVILQVASKAADPLTASSVHTETSRK